MTGLCALHSIVLSALTSMIVLESNGSMIGAPCRPRNGSDATENDKNDSNQFISLLIVLSG